MDEKLLHKLKQLLALSEGSNSESEKETAEKLLHKLLNKYDLNLEDIRDEKRIERTYKFTSNESKEILVQCVFCALEVNQKVYSNRYTNRYTKLVYCEVTNSEDVLIKELYEFHWKQYRKEKKKILRDLLDSYIIKHDLFSKFPSEEELSDFDLEGASRRAFMSELLEDVSYQKKLN